MAATQTILTVAERLNKISQKYIHGRKSVTFLKFYSALLLVLGTECCQSSRTNRAVVEDYHCKLMHVDFHKF